MTDTGLITALRPGTGHTPKLGTRPTPYVPAPPKVETGDQALLRVIGAAKGGLWLGLKDGAWSINRGYGSDKEEVVTFTKTATREGAELVKKVMERLMLDAFEVGYDSGYDDGLTDAEAEAEAIEVDVVEEAGLGEAEVVVLTSP